MKMARQSVIALLSGLFFVALVAPITKVNAAGAWENYGPSTATSDAQDQTQLQFSTNGTPYVASVDENDYDITVRRFNGTSWEQVGDTIPDSPGGAPINLILNSSNVPYVLYSDSSNGNKLSLRRLQGTSWELVGSAGFSLGIADGQSIAFDSNDLPYVAYPNVNNDEVPTVQHFNGTGWDVVGNPDDIAGAQPSTVVKIAVNSVDVPYIAFQDFNLSRKVVAMRFTGTAWEYVGDPNGFSEGRGFIGSLAMSADDVPYAAYSDVANGNRLTVDKFNGSDWEHMGTPGFSAGFAPEARLVLTSGNVPYIAYTDYANGRKATVQRFNGSDWEVVGSSGFTPGVAAFVTIALDVRDIPYVAYGDESQGYKMVVQRYTNGVDALSDPTTKTLPNATDNQTVKINSSFGTVLTCDTTSKEEDLAKTDPVYVYKNGFVKFCFNTDFTNNQVTIIFVTDLKTNEATVRKYNSTTGAYATIADATVTETTYVGQHALSVSYTIVDNGPLDENPAVGAITDPVGLGAVTIKAPDTGIAPIDSSPPLALLVIGSALLLIARRISRLASPTNPKVKPILKS